MSMRSSSFIQDLDFAPVVQPSTSAADETGVDDFIETLLKMRARTADAVQLLLGPWRVHRLGSTAGDNFYERVTPVALSKVVQMRQSIRGRRRA